MVVMVEEAEKAAGLAMLWRRPRVRGREEKGETEREREREEKSGSCGW